MSLEVINLVKVFDTQKAVDRISFVAPTGKITGFLGPNGAGKSTTLKIATGFIRPTSGDILVNDVSVTQDPMKVKKIVGYLPEHNPLYLEMYVKEYLDFMGKAYGMYRNSRQKRIHELLDLCGLTIEKDKKLKMLSKGYRQRVGLAQTLMSDPSVLILDEPTTGLDPNQIVEIRNVIKTIAHEKTVILSTHIMQEVEALCDKLVIIHRGKLVADDSLIHLQRKSSNQLSLSVQFDAPIDSNLFKSLNGIISFEVKSDHWLVLTLESERLRQEVLALITKHNLPLIAIKNVGGSLEEIFQKLTTEEGESSL
ncbi:MAG: gliding motility-associated ABC transporter ATP-binding subunit GldA [Flammeovirgaceae bacterium]|nr:gliding motility-associated ABC transporter ATP-binding subunit GldA [Flammeovirgaceae bacterium]|tara:strand:+ start:1419 stop:2348 length:930 start_codon:yes stop_codon:yes gene_type:complete